LRDAPAAELAARRAELQSAAQAAGLTPEDIGEVLNSRADLPRPLLPEERHTLLAVLTHADFDGRDALLAQVGGARVVGYCGCGCASINLSVDRQTPAAPRTRSPIPNEAQVLDDVGEPAGGVLVFLDDGYLALLEIYSYGNPLSPFPPLARLQGVSNPPG
jgi:hypothetical protein